MNDIEDMTGVRKSTFSNAGGNCVAIGATAAGVGFADTKNQGHGPVIRTTPAAYMAFIRQLHEGWMPPAEM
jgi:hypothetical protein